MIEGTSKFITRPSKFDSTLMPDEDYCDHYLTRDMPVWVLEELNKVFKIEMDKKMKQNERGNQ